MKMKTLIFSLLAVGGILSMNSQILYKIENKDGGNASYVFGSHHLSPISIVEESGVMEYFDKTGRVVGEIDLTVNPMEISMALQPYMMAPADSTLSVLLKGENLDSLNIQFERWAPMPGMQLQMLEPLKPVAVATMLAAGMSQEVMPGFDPSQQLDAFFFQQGKKDGKTITALETPEYQGEVLFNMTPLSVQAESLIEMLKNPEESVEAARKLSEAYKNRDLNSMLEEAQQDDSHPEFMEAILFKRNRAWLEKLPAIIEEGPAFIVVGALHLAGDEGIIKGLEEKGFVITPIY